MDEKVEALSNLIDKIVKKEILLPDFQRKFIWKEEEKQGRLIASVLAKMPIGSILLLDSDAKDYAYKMPVTHAAYHTIGQTLGIRQGLVTVQYATSHV